MDLGTKTSPVEERNLPNVGVMKHRRGLVGGVLAAALLLTSPAVRAEPSKAELQTARTLFSEAVADEGVQKWKQALGKLERVAAIKVTPGVLTHIALCKENLGRLLEAVEDYGRAGELARTEKNKSVQEAVEDALAKLRARVPSLRVVVAPREGLEVTAQRVLPDETRVTLKTFPTAASAEGHTLQVDPGDYDVTVRAPGARDFHATRNVPEGQITTVQVELDPGAPAAPVPVVPVAAAPTAPVEKEHEGFWTTRNTLTVGLVGAGLLATAAGAGFALSSKSKKDDAEGLRDRLGPSQSSCSGATDARVVSNCRDLRDAVDAQNSRANLSLGAYIAGGTLLVGGVAVWLLWPKSKPKEQAGYVAPVIDVAGRSVGLQGAF